MSYITDKFDKQAVGLLKSGGVGFMPADTVYGLSCCALNQRAVERIYHLKHRSKSKPFIILISDIDQLKTLTIDPAQAEPIKKYWPGAITYICRAPKTPQWLHRGNKTIAVRLPGYQELRKLIRQVGPIVSTSANLQGEEPVNSIADALSVFGDKLDFYVDAGRVEGRPSTLVKFRRGKLEVLRQGAVKILD